MKISLTGRHGAAFTLIELVISAAIGSMILVGAYVCLSAGLSTQKMIDPRVDSLQTGRVILAMMSADLRAACPLDKKFAFLGTHGALGLADADKMEFATHHYMPRRPNEADYCEMGYFVQPDAATGKLQLWRRRNPTLAFDPLSGGRREQIADDLEAVRFEYTDGYDWYTDWGQTNTDKMTGLLAQEAANLQGMPEAVRITLSFAAPASGPRANSASESAPPPQPMVFQAVVRLELADAGSLPVASGSSSSSAQTPNANSPDGTPQGPMEGLPEGGPGQ